MAESTRKIDDRIAPSFSGYTLIVLALLVMFSCTSNANGQQLDELSLDRWALLRETERYQLKIAEQFYRERNYKVALAEYEKYLSLYEQSEGAAYSQMKWSICQVKLRKSNTAIKEGFQSVIDYWPDLPEAIASAYYIGNTYQGMGQIKEAKKAYRELLAAHPKHLASAYAASGMVELAALENDEKTRAEMWRLLTFETQRSPQSVNLCITASQQLAVHLFSQAAFDDGVKSLATTYTEGEQLSDHVIHFLNAPLNQLCSNTETATQGEKLAMQAIAWYRAQMPAQTDDATKKLAQKQWFHIAAIHALARHDDEVPKVYEQIVSTFGADDETFNRLAQFHKTRDKYDEARKTYGRYVDKVEGLNQIAYSHRQQSKPDLAVTVYNQLLGLDAEHAVRWKAEIGATHRAVKQYEQAIAMYEQLVVEDFEKEEEWRWQIATAYQEWGKYPEAIAQYRLSTRFPGNYQNMAWCNRQLKQYSEAIILYNQVMTHEPSAPWALLQIGYTQEAAGQKEQAIKSFQIVCKKFPKDAHASQAHAHLQNEYKISVTLGGAKDE